MLQWSYPSLARTAVMALVSPNLKSEYANCPSGTENLMQSLVSFSDFSVSVCTEENSLIKLQVHVSGTITDSIFKKVFTKNVAAAQPLPGFRRMKGGKTPDIPKEVALHLIGPSKVKKETIMKIINSTVVEYVRKEGLTASKNLSVQHSYEELEAAFEPGKELCFGATVRLD
uniref:peptidylprolyl isomerase n=1 Tax=Zea mays TaxID=4577 RepID=A0A804QDP7_MAIZE